MRALAFAAALALSLGMTLALATVVSAQAQDAGVAVDPATGERFRELRPPEGLRRGMLQTEPWVVYTVAGAAIGAGLVVLARRIRRSALRGRSD